jgi:FkbM family methyltransferase
LAAHKGAYTYWMLKSVGSKGHIYSFEPQEILANRLKSLGYKNLTVEAAAVSDQDGTGTRSVPIHSIDQYV